MAAENIRTTRASMFLVGIRFAVVLSLLAVQSSSAYADRTRVELVSAPETLEDGTRARIEERLQSTLEDVGRCVGEQRLDDGLTFEMTIDRDGRVGSVSDPGPIDHARCVRDVLQRLRFDPLSDETTISVRVAGEQMLLLGRLVAAGAGSAVQQPQPRVLSGNTTVRGSLSQEVIRRVIRRHIQRVRHCYERALAREPNLRGRLTVRFVIAAGGTVQSASVSGDTLGNAAVSSCVVQVVRAMRFPAPSGGIVAVTYPFIFRASNTNPPTSAMTVPTVMTGMAQVQGSLARSEILRVVRRNQRAVRHCYERELQRNPSLAGRIAVQFEILATGRVGSARATSDTIGSPAVASCLVSRVRRWRFPQPTGGGTVNVTYPFVFSTR